MEAFDCKQFDAIREFLTAVNSTNFDRRLVQLSIARNERGLYGFKFESVGDCHDTIESITEEFRGGKKAEFNVTFYPEKLFAGDKDLTKCVSEYDPKTSVPVIVSIRCKGKKYIEVITYLIPGVSCAIKSEVRFVELKD
jgi:hypothetical protein